MVFQNRADEMDVVGEMFEVVSTVDDFVIKESK
jgi:hypothetical protein